MKLKTKGICQVIGQAAAAVLLLVFLAGVSLADVAGDLAAGKLLQDVIEDSLSQGMTVDALMEELLAADEYGKDIICGLFAAEAEKYEVIEAALNNDMDKADVVNWSYQCGASRGDIQHGFSIAGESLPPGSVFQRSQQAEDNAKDYLYNPPSPNK